MTSPTYFEQEIPTHDKKRSLRPNQPLRPDEPLSEVARKLGRGFASRFLISSFLTSRVSKPIGEGYAKEVFNKLSEDLRGSVITPENSEYEVARKVYNGMIDRRPDAIVRCADVADARRWLFVMPQDWTWWVWLVTGCLLLIGLMGMPEAFLVALLLSIAQFVLFFARERAFKAFPVQLRLAYMLLLIICFFPPIRWLFWLPAVGTFALVIFGYCLMARILSLLPWNRTEPFTADLLRRTFLSRPRLLDRVDSVSSAGCGAGLCSIEAQVEPGTGQGGTTLGRSP